MHTLEKHMKAIFAVHKDGGRMLVGIKSNSFGMLTWAQERAEALKLLDFVHLVEEPLLESLSVNELVEMTNDLIATLRRRAEEPVVVKYADDITFEVRPHDDDNRVLVCAKGRGDTVVNYQAEGLHLEVYAEEEIGSLSNGWYGNVDLVSENNPF